jgi:pimeloyl-ACP methyl ester carboxylesterase
MRGLRDILASDPKMDQDRIVFQARKNGGEVKGASHAVMISHPDEVAAIIRKAAESVTP